jgi:VWA domain-containing protein/aerotolerance regulator-like protein
MGFLSPLAFVFAGLYGVLVLFYLWERWRRRVTVPSLLLWAAVREDTLRARRFRPDLLFVLQLLLLTCLIFGLARPYLSAHGAQRSGRHLFVLDTTASMQAREGRGSRFEEARGQALKLLSSLDADDEVMLVSAGRTPEVLINFTRDHAAVSRLLEATAPTDAGGDLSVALAFVDGARQRSDVPTEVDVFTDIPASQLPPAERDQVTVFQVGESDDNIGIEALQIFQGRFQDYRSARAYVLLENFAHREGHGFLTVRLEDRVVERSGFTLAPRESRGFLIHDFPGPGRVSAQLEGSDALAADNVAYGWIRPVTPVRILLVSPPSPLLGDLRGLAAATSGIQLTVLTPDEFPAEPRQADLVIFHRLVPDPLPPLNALYIYPPDRNPLLPAQGNAENIEVLDWNARHATLQSLRPLAALPLQRARIVTPPPWSQVLLWSRTVDQEFPLALAGEYNGHRLACITFDLEAERLLSSDNVNFFLFFMNLLAWLSPQGDDALVVNTGDVEALPRLPAQPVRVRDPRGNVATLPVGQASLQPLLAGEYRISSDGTGRTLLANFFDPLESDIGRATKEPPVYHRIATSTAAAPLVPRNEYGAWLYGAAVALFLVEWAAARRLAA